MKRRQQATFAVAVAAATVAVATNL